MISLYHSERGHLVYLISQDLSPPLTFFVARPLVELPATQKQFTVRYVLPGIEERFQSEITHPADDRKSFTQCFPGIVIRLFTTINRMLHKECGGPPLFLSGSANPTRMKYMVVVPKSRIYQGLLILNRVCFTID